jgi:hypothetical protein
MYAEEKRCRNWQREDETNVVDGDAATLKPDTTKAVDSASGHRGGEVEQRYASVRGKQMSSREEFKKAQELENPCTIGL